MAQKPTAIILLILISLGMFLLIPPTKKASAFIKFDLTTAAQRGYNWLIENKEWVKESVLDPMAYIMAKELVGEISNNIVEWANGGFDGNPVFITNFGDLVENSANQATGVILEKLNTAGLNMCSEFAPMLKASFSYTKPFELNMKCTINDVIGNVEDFYNNFEEGGWKTWFALTMEPQNSPYGAYFTTWAEYQKAVKEKAKQAEQETQTSEGFASPKECRSGKKYLDNQGVEKCFEFDFKTPARTMADRIGAVTGIDIEQLQLADEFSEVLAAVTSNLTKKLFEDAGGGGSRGMLDYSPSPSQLEDDSAIKFMKVWTRAKAYHDLSTQQIDGDSLIYALRNAILTNLNSSLQYLEDLISCIENKSECLSNPAGCGITVGSDEWENLFSLLGDMIKFKVEKAKVELQIKAATERRDKSSEFVSRITAFWNSVNGFKNSADGSTGRAPNNAVEKDELENIGVSLKNITEMEIEMQELQQEVADDNTAAEDTRNLRDGYKRKLDDCGP